MYLKLDLNLTDYRKNKEYEDVGERIAKSLNLNLAFYHKYILYLTLDQNISITNNIKQDLLRTKLKENRDRSIPTIGLSNSAYVINQIIGGSLGSVGSTSDTKIYNGKTISIKNKYDRHLIPKKDGYILMIDAVTKNPEIIYYPENNLLLFTPNPFEDKNSEILLGSIIKSLWYEYLC